MSIHTETEPSATSPYSKPSVRGFALDGVLYILFLTFTIIGTTPFAVRDAVKLSQVSTGAGDMTRQALFITLATVLVFNGLANRRLSSLVTWPWPVMMTLCWFFLSITWSIAPDVSLRRCIFTTLICFSVFQLAINLGPARMLRLTTNFLAILLLVNFVSVFIVNQAVHLPGEPATELIGNWRGLHSHKNTAGPIAGISSLLFLVRALRTRSGAQWALLFLCITFVYFTRSKTTLTILTILLPLTLIAELSSRRPGALRIFVGSAYLVFVILLALLFVNLDVVVGLLSDPEFLTGRGAIWAIAWDYSSRFPWTGAGYSAFWGVGRISPVLFMTPDAWLQYIQQSHNGFLELLVTTGVPGLAFATFAAVVWPLWRLLRDKPEDFAPLFAVLVFSILLNLTEASMFNVASPLWVLHLIALAVIWRSTGTVGDKIRQSARGPTITGDQHRMSMSGHDTVAVKER